MADRGARTCPECRSGHTSVYGTRDREERQTIRYHVCLQCARKFQTVQEHFVTVHLRASVAAQIRQWSLQQSQG